MTNHTDTRARLEQNIAHLNDLWHEANARKLQAIEDMNNLEKGMQELEEEVARLKTP